MPLYRKKPVVIEAERLTVENFGAVGAWAGVKTCWGLDAPKPALHIETLEGTMKAFLGDYVIRGVQGEFYPCKAEIFEATYEPVAATVSDEDVIRRLMVEAQAHPGRAAVEGKA